MFAHRRRPRVKAMLGEDSSRLQRALAAAEEAGVDAESLASAKDGRAPPIATRASSLFTQGDGGSGAQVGGEVGSRRRGRGGPPTDWALSGVQSLLGRSQDAVASCADRSALGSFGGAWVVDQHSSGNVPCLYKCGANLVPMTYPCSTANVLVLSSTSTVPVPPSEPPSVLATVLMQHQYTTVNYEHTAVACRLSPRTV